MLVFTISVAAITSVLLTAQQIRIDFYKSKCFRAKKRFETLKNACDNQQETINRLNTMLTDALEESHKKGHVINYFDHVLRNSTDYKKAVQDLKGGNDE